MRRRSFTHGFDRWLVGQKVAAVNCVVKVLPCCVAFTLKILGRVDAALGAYGMRSFDRDDREKIDVTAGFRNLDGCCQPCQPAAYHDNFRSSYSHFTFSCGVLIQSSVPQPPIW